jgi:RND family efflux transporter MFP subunit
MKNYILFVLSLAILFFYGCKHNHSSHDESGHNHETNTHDHEGHDHGTEENNHDHEGHEHEGEAENTLHFIEVEKGYEVAASISPLVKGASADITVFITGLKDYSPLNRHEIELVFDGNKTVHRSAHGHGAGVYHGTFTPEELSAYQFAVEFNVKGETVNIPLGKLLVYMSETDFPHMASDDNLIEYHKEKAWKEDFGVEKIQPAQFSRIIKTSGEIVASPSDETYVTALHMGNMETEKGLVEGLQVNKGDLIAWISSEMLHQNLATDYQMAKTEFDNATSNYEQAKKLITEKLISEREYRDEKAAYERARSSFNNYKKYYSEGKEKVVAPFDGYIRSVFVKEGEFVNEGQPLFSVIKNQKMLLKANLPQQYYHLSADVSSANFKTTYTKELFKLDELQGKLLSVSGALPENNLFTPVYFEFSAQKELMVGSFAEVYLESTSTDNVITVPVSALMEDQGNYFVYTMEMPEKYRKTYVQTGDTDGERMEILTGLKPGDVIVSKGCYQVHLASLSNAAPAHTHSH